MAVSVPALSSKVDPEIRRAVAAIVSQLNGVLSGTIPVGYANTSGSTDSVISSDTTIPYAPSSLVATGAFNTIILTWDHGQSDELIAGFEIWRCTVDDLGLAVKVGWTPAKIYADIPSNTSSAIEYFYWVRAISNSSVAGPYNDSAGTSASTSTDPTYVMEILEGQITESELSDSLNERINLISGSGEQFDYQNIWYFDTGIESFTGNGTPTSSAGWLIPADHATDPYVVSPGTLAISGDAYGQIKIRIRQSGAPTWDGTIWWKNTGDTTWDAGRSITFIEPTYDAAGIANVTIDTGWTGEIAQIRIDLSTSQDSTDFFEIDWVAIGRPSPGASTAALTAETLARTSEDSALSSSIVSLTASLGGEIDVVAAAVVSESEARVSADDAMAETVETVQTTIEGHTTSIETHAESISGLVAQYTVKIDNNGYMAGFGLASTSVGGVPFSEFYAMADRFAIINPPVSPKIITSLTRVSTTATAVCAGHGFISGELRAITGAAQGEYNGIKLITVLDVDTFTYQVVVTAATPATVAAGLTNILVGESPAKIPFVVQSGIVYMDVAMIKDATITSAKIGDLGADKITSGYLAAARIEAGSITATHIGTNEIVATSANIKDATITSAKIVNATITGADIALATIGTANIIDANVTTLKIAGNAVIVPVVSYTSGSISLRTVITTVQQATITTGYTGVTLEINASFAIQNYSIANDVTVYLYRGTTLLYTLSTMPTVAFKKQLFSFCFYDTPGSTATTYYLKVYQYGGTALMRGLGLIGYKR